MRNKIICQKVCLQEGENKKNKKYLSTYKLVHKVCAKIIKDVVLVVFFKFKLSLLLWDEKLGILII